MKPDEFLNQFTEKLKELSPNTSAFTEEMGLHLRTAAMTAFDKLDLVTREEFDAQQAVLARTREKLDALETEVAQLEKLLARQKPAQNPSPR